MTYRFYTVDAFTDRMFEGANIAVLPEADGLTDMQMQKIAREFNLSETVFVFPPVNPSNARRVRIFTPLREISFAGHPTIAVAHVLASLGMVGQGGPTREFVLEQTVGPVRVTVEMGDTGPVRCHFDVRTPYVADRFVPTERELAMILGLSESDLRSDTYRPLVVACDQPYLIVPLSSFSAVREALFNHNAWSHSTAAGLAREILVFSSQTEDPTSDFHCRLLGPDVGVHDDPPIGSSMPAFSGYLSELKGESHRFSAERGAGTARHSLLLIQSESPEPGKLAVRMGGSAVRVSDGTLYLD